MIRYFNQPCTTIFVITILGIKPGFAVHTLQIEVVIFCKPNPWLIISSISLIEFIPKCTNKYFSVFLSCSHMILVQMMIAFSFIVSPKSKICLSMYDSVYVMYDNVYVSIQHNLLQRQLCATYPPKLPCSYIKLLSSLLNQFHTSNYISLCLDLSFHPSFLFCI